jgi:manganese/iron transport system ATP-binding protein
MPTLFRPAHHDERKPTLTLENVSVSYDGVTALENVSFRVERGDRVAVVGPNGAGKSTLFNVITGIIKPTTGTVDIYGSGPSGHICVGYVPQRNRIDWRFPVTVADVVMMGRTSKIGLLRRPGRGDREQVRAALERVGMDAYEKRQIGELSGGQQQRVFIARALAQEAELLLLDEPMSGLDVPSQEAILAILEILKRQGITLLVATHDLNQAAEQYPKIMLLNRRLIAYGAPEAVMTAETLGRAYGSQIHIVHNAGRDLLITDTCCDEGHAPVEPILTLQDHEAHAAPSTPERVR